MKNKLILCFISYILFSSCSEKIEFRELAADKAKEMNCMEDIELLVKNDDVELWASYSKLEEGLLCVYTCKNGNCFYSSERD